MSDRNGLPKGEFNLPPGVSVRDIPGEQNDVDTLLESLGKYISPDDVELDRRTFLGLVRDRIAEDLDAPDILAALKGLFEHCAMIHARWGEDSNQREADAAIKAARAAIAKAEGRL